MKPVRVLVIDDSATMRALLTSILRQDPAIEVVGSAGDPFEAREAIKRHEPDVVTLDVEMPGMSGIAFLEKIMRLRPMPVVMVSTLTRDGAALTLEALELGAVDCVDKTDLAELCEKVKAAATARVTARPPVAQAAHQASAAFGDQVIAIGSSTGGVEALLTVLSVFPANCPPTLITQHMPATFTASFAMRLDRTCAPHVREAFDGAPLDAGCVYIAPGGASHLEVTGRARLSCRLVEAPSVNGHRPSVDVLFRSVARVVGARGVGAILTGMGRDGAAGLLEMRHAGARTIGQDQDSSVVYGMPKAAYEIGAVERQVRLSAIGSTLIRLCETAARGTA
ncbi:MAG: chemotaxis response regulator protein-glutamate methylesterase [Alphaproteobacteria bacterium]|nr:chemotaxis response regulator protein-glutamate methylesterase [Alphaproteobacteria bacterium]